MGLPLAQRQVVAPQPRRELTVTLAGPRLGSTVKVGHGPYCKRGVLHLTSATPGDGARLPGQQHDVVGSSFAFVDAPVAPATTGYNTPPMTRPSMRNLQQQAQQASHKASRPSNAQSGRGAAGAGPQRTSTSTSELTQEPPAAPATTPTEAAVSSNMGNGSPAPTNGNGHSHPSSQPDIGAEETVAAALARAQEALNRVESSLGSIEDLPSAKPPSKWDPVLSGLRTMLLIGVCSSALVMSHAFGLWVQWASSLAGALGIAWWGYSRSSLSLSGAIAALVVGACTLSCSLRFGATLLFFFFSSSKLTHFKEEVKLALDESSRSGGQRNWVQVFCNGAVPSAIALAYGITQGCVDVPLGPYPGMVWSSKAATLLGGAFLGYYACCCGDTWASELGPLSGDTPRLITSMRPVRRGTNGGVTLLGLSASMLGGMFVGAVFYGAALVSPTLWVLGEGVRAAASAQWKLIPLGLMAGLLGSVLDSVLGATLQYTGYNRLTGKVTSKAGPDITHISGVSILDNNMVNMLSATATAGITGLTALALFGA